RSALSQFDMPNEVRCGHLIKLLFWDGQGLVLYAKRLERGKFVWPQARDGAISLTPAQLSMLLDHAS
ncbi:IS66 family insertion sequence element accessory protein TnpB, partial [Pseudoroseomonas ludipueritiae]